MNASTIGVVVVLLIVVVLAIRASRKHMKGDGGCCGGGGTLAEPEKKLDGPILGRKILHIEGMHCDNCKNSVERAINRIDGASCKVNLKKNLAEVSYDRPLDEAELRRAVEWLDFKVLSIEDAQ